MRVVAAEDAGSLTADSQRAPERMRSQEPRAQAGYLPMFLLLKAAFTRETTHIISITS